MNKLNKIFTVSALVLALSACNDDSDNQLNVEGGVSISGETISGQTLTATVLDVNGVNEANISYQWLSNGVAITGATASSYTITDNEVDTTITVAANYTDNDNFVEAITSEATSVVEAITVNTEGTVAITGTIESGKELTATITDDNGLSLADVSYAWLAGTDTIGTDASTVTLTNDEIGKTITVTVTYTDNDNFAESVTSEATTAVAPVGPAPAEFSGDLTASVTSNTTSATTGSAVVTDINDGEDTFQAVTDIATTYGTFSITTAGGWTYTLDQDNATIAALTSDDDDVVDSITLTSFDGTTTTLTITITGGEVVPNNVVKITDTVTETVGDLKVITAEQLQNGVAVDAIAAGKVTFSFNYDLDGLDTATDLTEPQDGARISLFGERNAASRALVELRFINDGTIAIRDDGNQYLIDQTYAVGEWVDVEITWDANNATADVTPTMNIKIDGTAITSTDPALVITAGSYTSFSTHPQHVDTGMQNVQFKLGSTAIVTGTSFFVDDLKAYSDLAGTVIAFEDDFEQHAVGTLVTQDVDESSPYILNLNNSATPEIVTLYEAPEAQ